VSASRLPGWARISLWVAAFLIAIGVGFGPRWWENRTYRQVEAIAGVAAPIRPGRIADARGKIDRGRTSADVVGAIGRPSLESASDGELKREIWTYYFADGTMIINLSGGVVERVGVTFGPPRIPTSARP
jgi:hypothetical protein